MNTNSWKSAFTLVEMLVVIGIVMFLIAIMLPSLGRAREQSRQLACATNMRAIAQAVTMYADENFDSFPVTTHIAQDGGWILTVAEYLEDQHVYRCPSDASTDWFRSTDTPAEQLVNDRVNSYATNVYIAPRIDPPPGAIDTRPKYGYLVRRLIPYPAATVHFAELQDTSWAMTAADHLHADQWLPSPLTGLPLSDPKEEVAIGRHLKQENYAFTDGHIETRSFKSTFELAADGTTPLRDHWNPVGLRAVNP